MSWVLPVILTGNLVRLEPMTEADVPTLAEIGAGQHFWRLMLYGEMKAESDIRNWVLDILSREGDVPFVVRHLPSGRVAGATRFMNVNVRDKGLEIGGTWYGLEFQQTGVNTECKYLLLKHAFESLGAIRVQLKTDSRNIPSQKAIERIGGVKEGILRNHMILPDGTIRHSVIYSILDVEWLDVKKKLEILMAKY